MPLSQQVSITVANETVGLSVKIINIPEDSLRLTLKEQTERIRKASDIGDIIGAIGLLTTSVAALVSGYDEHTLISPEILKIIFLLGFIGSIVELSVAIKNYTKAPITVDTIIDEIYNKISLSYTPETVPPTKTKPNIPQAGLLSAPNRRKKRKKKR